MPMKFGDFWFKDDPERAWVEFRDWTEKWIKDEVQSGMLILLRADRSMVFTLSAEPTEMSRADRMRLVLAASEAIASNASDSEHTKLP